MERVFGVDFSAVRIHQGGRAAALGALACTQGSDIHFSPGQYDPRSQRGQELLGHELAHVVQQAQGRVAGMPQAKGVAINSDPALEREADEAGARAAVGDPVRLGTARPTGDATAKAPVQRMLVKSKDDNTRLSTIDAFATIPPDTELWEDEVKYKVTFLGINNRDWSTVYLRLPSGEPVIYRVTDAKLFPYDAGQPSTVVMTIKRVVNGDVLSDGVRHCGVMYEFSVAWAEKSTKTDNGVMITEMITPMELEGWFAQSGERKQTAHVSMAPSDTYLDLIGISENGKASTEKSLTESKGETATKAASGMARFAQHFEYVDSSGQSKKIPNSGFMLIKTMRDGVLSIQRVPAEVSGVGPGKAETTKVDIHIKFGD